MGSTLKRIGASALVFLFLLLGSITDQTKAQSINLGPENPQVLSPNAYEMVKYGRVPVDFFNGLANVTIPLTEVKAKDYTLPIYLTYHGAGNKTEQHPGWVGLGWALHAGGSITRIRNGLKDEVSQYEGNGNITAQSNYLEHAYETQHTIDWSKPATLFNTAITNGLTKDFAPDEFVVNLEGISASFYITGNNEIKIVSKGDASFDVSWELGTDSENTGLVLYTDSNQSGRAFRATRYRYFKSFVLKDREGNAYHFGGNDNAIEYTVDQHTPYYSGGYTSVWQARATATTWMLTKIERANGEVITFTYKRDGVPIVLNDLHRSEARADNYGNGYSYSTYNSQEKSNLNFTFLTPCYLTKISCRLSGETYSFTSNKTVERGYDINETDFYKKIGYFVGTSSNLTLDYSYADFMAKSYYLKLTGISGKNCNIALNYTSSTSERLKLLSVQFKDKSSGSVAEKYKFTYNSTKLPAYNARVSDAWGYYNGKNYISVIEASGDKMFKFRTPNADKMKAEILTKITYPTGGSTTFEYEPHTYGKIANQFPFNITSFPGSTMAGGLRIKSIPDRAGSRAEKREFIYEEQSGSYTVSSGILSGRLNFNASGTDEQDGYSFSWVYYSEAPLNRVSDTNGSHVTYSKVRENMPDGSSTVYYYSNHDTSGSEDTAPDHTIHAERGSYTQLTGNQARISLFSQYNSGALFRGFLLKKELFDNNGTLVRKEENTYYFDRYTYLKTISRGQYGYMIAAYSKIYCGYPYHSGTVIYDYPDGPNGQVHHTYVSYQHNDIRKITQIERQINYDQYYTQEYFYAKDRKGLIYSEMIAQGMEGVPVGVAEIHNGKVVAAEELEYKKVSVDRNGRFNNVGYFPAKLYRLKTASAVSASSYRSSPFTYLNTVPDEIYAKYDNLGRLTAKTTSKGVSTVYGWFVNTTKPTYSASNVRVATSTVADRSNSQSFPLEYTKDNFGELEFDTIGDSRTISVSISPAQNYNWLIGVDIDNKSLTLCNISYVENPMNQYWLNYVQQYPGGASVTVPAGHHKIRVYKRDVRKGNNAPNSPAGSVYINYYKAETVTTGTSDIVRYEDFEYSNGNDTGFNSNYGHKGSYSISQSIPSDRQYVLDYMRKDSNTWTYYRHTFTGSATIGSSTSTIDNVRIYPADADIKSYTWDNRDNLRSVTDASGRVESYAYDGMDRLISVSDLNGNKVKSYQYLIASQANAGSTSRRDSNYVKTINYMAASSGSPATTIQWYDGLGREISNQKVSYASAGDVSTDVAYDLHGRIQYSYEPIPDSHRGTPSTEVYGEPRPYSEIVYEKNPLDRVQKTIGAGNAWRSNGKGVIKNYKTNTTSGVLSCYRLELSYSGATTLTGQITNRGLWRVGELTITLTTDEDGRKEYIFTDLGGKTVMTRKIDGSNYLDTYMVYDDMNRLAAVVPPILAPTVTGASSSIALTNASIKNYAYLYRYDTKGRCIAKMLPGAGWTYYVYDVNDRLVFSQDEEQRSAGKWAFTLSDLLGRPCLTGLCSNSINLFEPSVSSSSIYAKFTSASSMLGYTVVGVSLSNTVLLSANYYDNYDFITISSVPSATRTKLQYAAGPSGYSGTKWNNAAGSLTGSVSRILGENPTNDYLWSSVYYNGKGDAIQSRNTRQDGGVDITNIVYTFTGKPSKVRIDHNRGTGSAIVEEYQYSYDGWGRETTVKHRLNSGSWVNISDKTYDKIGRLASDKRTGTTALKETYTYNPRSWMKKLTGPGFTETLSYENGSTPQWAGNISSISWTGADGVSNTDNYTYDNLSRLKTAISKVGSTTSFSETYDYDKHSNITRIVHSGVDGSETRTMAYTGNRATQLNSIKGYTYSFTYDAIGRLKSSGADKIGTVRYNAIGYPAYMSLSAGGYVQNTYTAGGNRIASRRTDSQNVVTTMSYEGNEVYENGTLKMLLFNGGYVDYSAGSPSYHWYTYDHLGNVRAVADASGNIMASYRYLPYGQEFAASTPRASVSGAVKSEKPAQLGNIPKAMYAPSTGSDWQPYRFGGKEILSSVGLDLYDFGARLYSPVTGRWMTMDPLCEKYYSISPYAYCAGNPINFVDPTGMEIENGSLREWEMLKKQIERERDRLQSNINRLNARANAKGWSSEKLARKIGNKAERLASLNSSIETMGTLEGSKQVYSLSHTKSGENGGVTLNTSTNVIDIKFGSTANFVHEMTHAGQFESGDIAFSNEGNTLLQDVYDEAAAYKAQFGFSPSSVTAISSTSVADAFGAITPTWVQGIVDPSGSMLYAAGGSANTGLIPVNINSTKENLIKAYPWINGLNALPADIRKIPGIYYKR